MAAIVPQEISIGLARRIAVGAQGFAECRPRGRVARRHLRKSMGRLHLLQLDSVPVVIRTQYMPLFSRLGPYRTELLDEIAYESDEWFEAWSHEASLLPVEMEPWLRWSKGLTRRGETGRHLHRQAQRDPGYIQAVLDEVRARGPLTAAELSDARPGSGSWWGSRSGGAVALDWLYRIGEVGVRRDRRFVKKFDLLERIVPANIRSRPTPDFKEALDELLLRAARAYGVATADCLVDYFRLPVRPAKARLQALVEDDRIQVCRVAGWNQAVFLDRYASRPRTLRRSALLSPFDPLIWNRKRIAGLFDFHYKIEIYTPAEKRQYGYYVMPFLLGERLVARFDLKTDRDKAVLRVLAAHAEPGVSILEVARAAATELGELAKLVGVNAVQVGRRGNLAASLCRRLLASG